MTFARTDLISAIRGKIALAILQRGTRVDPLKVFLHDDQAPVLWEYLHSRTDPMLPGHPHQAQLRALASRARHRFLFWGNQSGKTTLGAVDAVAFALGCHPYDQWVQPPVRIWASALSWELWETILLPELLTWIPPDRIIRAPEPNVSGANRLIEIRADNGQVSRIWGKSAEQGASKYQSARIHKFWSDEEHPEAVWDEVLPRLVRFGGRTLNTMTPLKGLTWVYHRIYEPWKRGELPDVYVSHAGMADNPSIRKEELESITVQLKHNPGLLTARLHGLFHKSQGLALRFDPERHFQAWDNEQVAGTINSGMLRPFAGIDFGAWRFSFLLLGADAIGRIHALHEYFSQRELLEARARAIAKVLIGYGVLRLRIWGDSAASQDIMEMNAAFRRLESDPEFAELDIRYRVVPVQKTTIEGRTYRAGAVEKLNDLFGRDALLVRRDLGASLVWRLGMTAAKDGQPILGSRLLWEMNNWGYDEPREGEAQRQDPSDDSADGADMIAAMRMAILEHLRPGRLPDEGPEDNPNIDRGLEKHMAQQTKMQRARVREMRRLLRQAGVKPRE